VNFFDFKESDIENLDNNELFQLSLRAVEEFSVEKILDFINDIIFRSEIIIEGFMEANVMTPGDTLALKNLCRCSESLALVEHWIRKNAQIDEVSTILDNSNDEL